MKKETVSRFNEVVLTTSDLTVLKGKYLTENLYRRWEEKFVDEDTGEFVPIERREIILYQGEELTDENLQTIKFFMDSGELKEVSVSNLQRSARFRERTQGNRKGYPNAKINIRFSRL